MDPSPTAVHAETDALARIVERAARVVAVTGAGVSTASGIPAYRDDDGRWTARTPVRHAEFVGREDARRRYWARSFVAWPRFASARPGAAHEALARLEAAGRLAHVVTQNVDGLHARAGSRAVTDLHGRLHEVVCRGCGEITSRDAFQVRLGTANPGFEAPGAVLRPDGDAELPAAAVDGFVVPSCVRCGGTLKPAVVFFGGNVPADVVAATYARVASADLLLVAGTSLEVFSGRRFVDAALAAGTPVAIVNRGSTRADARATVRAGGDVGQALRSLADTLLGRSTPPREPITTAGE